MNFLDTLVFIGELASKLHEPEYITNTKQLLKDERIKHNLSFTSKLPEFASYKIMLQEKTLNCGTVIKRPLDLPSFISEVEYHYGVVIGTSISGEEIVLEMTKSNNVRLNNIAGFQSKYNIEAIEIENINADHNIDDILARAKRYQFDNYNLVDLNCKDFAYYLAYQIEPPKRSIELKKIQLSLMDISISYRQLQLSDPVNSKYKNFLKDRILDLQKEKAFIVNQVES